MELASRSRRNVSLIFGLGFRAAPGLMTGVVALTLLGVAASVAFPIGFRLLVEGIVQHQVWLVVWAIVLIVVFYGSTWGVTIVTTSELAALGERCNLYLCTYILDLINASPTLEHFERDNFNKELNLLEANRKLLAGGPRQCLAFLQMALRAVAAMVILSILYVPFTALFVVAFVPVAAEALSSRARRESEEGCAELRAISGELFRLATGPSGGRELRVYGAKDALVVRHRELGRELEKITTRGAARAALVSTSGWLVFGAGLIGAVVVFVLRAANRQASIGDVVLGVSLLRQMQLQVGRASESTGQMGTIRRTAGRLLWLEDHVRDVRRTFDGKIMPADRLKRGISLVGVSFAYPGSERPVLSGIDLDLPAGKVVAIVGNNGAGKTSLVKLIAGMYQPSEGTIYVDDTDLRGIDLLAWRSKLSAAFQDFAPFHLPAYQVVGIGDLPKVEDRRRVRSALKRAHSIDVLQSLRDGLTTEVGRTFAGGQDLSGGQWQKLALGRAMMRHRPLVMLFDEPTANLDASTEERLVSSYIEQGRRYKKGRLTIVVSHRFATVRAADLIVVLNDGQIEAVGSHAELICQDGLYSEMFGLYEKAYA